MMDLSTFLNSIKYALIKAKGECERKGGNYCPGPKYKVCYLILKEEVSSFEEAEDLCDKYDAELPMYSIIDYANFLNCVYQIFLLLLFKTTLKYLEILRLQPHSFQFCQKISNYR
ncbi:hypothetical protein Avbf_06111 [Armadillidium vulgare]|nr:hypothetical protein Avbf_06111 [Armadillidium vulgare]